MESTRKGTIVLGVEPSPEARDRLVATLLKIYPKYTTGQLLALVSKPKPLELIKGVDEGRAVKFVEALGAQGVPLQFVADTPAAPTPPSSAPTPSPPPSSREETALIPSPTASSAPAAPAPAQTGGQSLGFAAPPPASTTAQAAETSLAQPSAPPAQPVPQARPRRVAMKFTGSAGEYFRIWIVNAALTILTLGIYGAWAKVRTRRYFYANTVLDGQPFDYTAKPGTILKGHLIVGGALVVMNVSSKLTPLIGGIISAAAWCALPFLLYKAHRFKAKSSAYRNIRFRFLGDVRGAYKAYAFIPIGVVLGLVMALPALLSGEGEVDASIDSGMAVFGFAGAAMILLAAAFPWFIYLQRRYLHGNLAYGRTSSLFTGGARRFYSIYARSSLMMLALPFLGGILFALFGTTVFRGGGQKSSPALFLIPVVAYGLLLLFLTLIQQYIYASTFNYSWGSTRLGPITFDVNLSAKSLAWIRLTNVLAIIFSLGFLMPWAKVRRARYILPLTTAVLPADMGAFQAAADSDVGAVGDTAADFFDWDIGW